VWNGVKPGEESKQLENKRNEAQVLQDRLSYFSEIPRKDQMQSRERDIFLSSTEVEPVGPIKVYLVYFFRK
jgi:hypothetical protein